MRRELQAYVKYRHYEWSISRVAGAVVGVSNKSQLTQQRAGVSRSTVNG
jgi:hypothetical protein